MEREFVIVFDRGIYSVMWRYVDQPTSASQLLTQMPTIDMALSAIQDATGAPVILKTVTRG